MPVDNRLSLNFDNTEDNSHSFKLSPVIDEMTFEGTEDSIKFKNHQSNEYIN